jgi:hypothetical protein
MFCRSDRRYVVNEPEQIRRAAPQDCARRGAVQSEFPTVSTDIKSPSSNGRSVPGKTWGGRDIRDEHA